jgi:fructose/tagatose bisphosphate aldolase
LTKSSKTAYNQESRNVTTGGKTMPFVTTRRLLLDAQNGGYAIGAFNAENMEMVQAIIMAAEEMNAPVIVQTTAGTLKYAPPRCFSGMVGKLAAASKVPVALHLDHAIVSSWRRNACGKGTLP